MKNTSRKAIANGIWSLIILNCIIGSMMGFSTIKMNEYEENIITNTCRMESIEYDDVSSRVHGGEEIIDSGRYDYKVSREPYAVHLGDVDKDGDLDIVTASHDDNGVSE